MTSPHAPSSVAVAIDGTPPSANPVGYIRRDGSFQWTARGTPEITIALRNLAADPGRRFRRYGFESMLCPFCGDRLRHGTLSFGVGYCAECAHRVGWPHDERAAKLAEDLLRRDIMREIEEEDESHGLDGKA